jgi:hypothetical protein
MIKMSLYEMACLAPDTIMLFALPAGTIIHFDANGPIKIKLNDVELPIQPGSYLDRLSKTPPEDIEYTERGRHHERFKGWKWSNKK